MDGLKPGRIVYLVLSAVMASEITRRRTTGASIAERMKADPPSWPPGAQAHVGNGVAEGDSVPAMVVAVVGDSSTVNLKAMLDGSDTYWATSVPYAEWSPDAESLPEPGTWHWMFNGQQTRYDPTKVRT